MCLQKILAVSTPLGYVIAHRGVKTEFDELVFAKDSGSFHPFGYVIAYRGVKTAFDGLMLINDCRKFHPFSSVRT